MSAVVSEKNAERLAKGDIIEHDGDRVPLICDAMERIGSGWRGWRVIAPYDKVTEDGHITGWAAYDRGERVQVYGSAA